MRDKLVELAIPRPINSDVWFVGPKQVQVSVDGYIVDRHDLTGPAGLEDLLSRIQPLPPRPQYGDVCAEDTKIRVDARGELVVTYAFEGVELTELHAYLARWVDSMRADLERGRADLAVREARATALRAEQAARAAAQAPTPVKRRRWWG